jgi:hypothetical protein
MIRISWILPAVALAATGGCVVVSSETVTRNYDIAGFDSVSAHAGVNVLLKQGPFDVSAEGPRDRIDNLRIEKRGSSLVISREPDVHVGWFGWSERDLVTVVAPDFAAIEAGGGADVDVDPMQLDTLDIEAGGGADVNSDGLRLDALRIRANGGADVNAHRLVIASLDADSSGGADISVSGDCRSANVRTSGGADFRGEDLRCETATVDASGGGDADVTATASASGRASSGGDVRFHGNPVRFEKEESGGGDVNAGR